ncbi:MAG TPA: AbgT family transporter, partial [Candidatus Kapabacteria bacterium]|nr:AbgT family transporter [Candidatus Kapabacteria bacterium]
MKFKLNFANVFNKSLDIIEIVGNKLPHPATIFGLLALSVAIISFFGDLFNWQAVHPS